MNVRNEHSMQNAPTIYKLNPDDDWVESYDIVYTGDEEMDFDYDAITDTLPACATVKQIGTAVTNVAYINVEGDPFNHREVGFGIIDYGELNSDIFKYAVNVTDFSYAFYNSNILNIPADLFKNCQKATNFDCAFFETNIKSIPENLFDSCPNANSFWYTFVNCHNLGGRVPELWNKFPAADNGGEISCFDRFNNNITNINEIPDNWLTEDEDY